MSYTAFSSADCLVAQPRCDKDIKLGPEDMQAALRVCLRRPSH